MPEAYRFNKLPLFFFVFTLFQLFLIRKETDIKPGSLKVKNAGIKSEVIFTSYTHKHNKREEKYFIRIIKSNYKTGNAYSNQ